MSTLKKCFKAIKSEDTRAINSTPTKALSICVNLIQVPYPEEDSTLFTVTAMKDGHKLNCIPPMSFAKVMGYIEDRLEILDDYFPYGMSLLKSIDTPWYVQLECHRVFLIRTEDVFKVLSLVFNKETMTSIKGEGINNVRVLVRTLRHNMQIDM